MRVKVCGITQVSQLLQLQQMGVNYAGLIFYDGSKRCVGADIKSNTETISRTSIYKVGVFVNEKIDKIADVVKLFNLSAVQLHGSETPEFCRTVSQLVPVVKAFQLSDGEDADQLVEPYHDVVNYYLFDTKEVGSRQYGGTGKKFNWDVVQRAEIGKPFFVSGGIGPDDVQQVKAFQHPFLLAVDVNSRFELAPGIKDMDKIRLFVNDVR